MVSSPKLNKKRRCPPGAPEGALRLNFPQRRMNEAAGAADAARV